MAKNSWFEVDKEGLRQLLAGKGPWLVLRELIQNAWDESGVTCCKVTLRPEGHGTAFLVVEDDAPEGFYDLTHAYTLYAHTRKRVNAEKRGRFNLGEKQVLALCKKAEIITTTGHVRFLEDGRRVSGKEGRESGSCFMATIRMNKAEIEEALRIAHTFLSPKGISTVINNVPLRYRETAACFETSLETEIWKDGADGVVRKPTRRRTTVEVLEPQDNEIAMIYEMGLPVMATGDKWHYNVMQRVPLTSSRDNVKAAWLRDLRAEVLNHMASSISEDEASEGWVRDGTSDDRISEDALEVVATKRWGQKRCVLNPNDPYSREHAITNGYTVVSPRDMSKQEWDQARRAETIPSAVSLFPRGFVTAEIIDPAAWTEEMHCVRYLVSVLCDLLYPKLPEFPPDVVMVKNTESAAEADYGGRTLRFNVGVLGKEWFQPDYVMNHIRLIVHEICHEFGGHLDKAYIDALAYCAAKLALADPALFELETAAAK